jgi:hypothetical protein
VCGRLDRELMDLRTAAGLHARSACAKSLGGQVEPQRDRSYMRTHVLSLAVLLVCACAACAAATSKQEPTPGVVYVCHGNTNPRWLRISASAADAHRRHGDRVSEVAQRENSACEQEG